MSAEENKAVLRRFIEAYDRGDLAATRELFSPDCKLHYPGTPGPMGPEEAVGLLQMFRSAFPEGRHTVHHLIAEEDLAVGHWTFRGTHQGEFQGIPPTGNQVEASAINVARIEDGKIAEWWAGPDTMGMMQQLGVVPPPGQA